MGINTLGLILTPSTHSLLAAYFLLHFNLIYSLVSNFHQEIIHLAYSLANCALLSLLLYSLFPAITTYPLALLIRYISFARSLTVDLSVLASALGFFLSLLLLQDQ